MLELVTLFVDDLENKLEYQLFYEIQILLLTLLLRKHLINTKNFLLNNMHRHCQF